MILIIVFLLSAPYYHKSSEVCSGVLCDDSCENCYACSTNSCKIENNCFCASSSIPGDIPLEDTPQFILFTLDDAITTERLQMLENFDFLLKNPKIKDANGCPIKISGYMNSVNTDFNVINWLDKIGSVSLHTVTHTTSSSTNKSTWFAELNNNYKSLSILGQINNISGARAPYFAFNNEYFQTLTELGMQYDSSTYTIKVNEGTTLGDRNYLWPFTLDYGFPHPDYCLQSGECPTQIYPGLWEFSITTFQKANGASYTPMDYSLNDNIFDDFKNDFTLTFNKNRVPRGLYLHFAYFTYYSALTTLDPAKKNFVQQFYEWIAETFSDKIFFATEKMVIDWIKNPKTISEIRSDPTFRCSQEIPNPLNTCSWTICNFPEGYIRICGNKCPNKYPNIYGDWENTSGDLPSTWLGSDLKFTVASNWNIGMCADVSLRNPLNYTASSFVMTMKLFHGELTSIWGNSNSYLKEKTDEYEVWRIIVNRISLEQFAAYEGIGLCAKISDGFFGQIGVDFHDATALNCDSINPCTVFCGDGECSQEENDINCPIDCNINNDNNTISNETTTNTNETTTNSNETTTNTNETTANETTTNETTTNETTTNETTTNETTTNETTMNETTMNETNTNETTTNETTANETTTNETTSNETTTNETTSNETTTNETNNNSNNNGTNNETNNSTNDHLNNRSSYIDCVLWPGNVRYEVTSSWENGLCGNIYLKNTYSCEASSFVLSLDICENYANLTAFYGDQEIEINGPFNSLNIRRYREIVNSYYTKYGNTDTYIGGFCLTKISEFDFNRHFRLGADLRANILIDPNSSVVDVVCGDDYCGETEDNIKCSIDCNPAQCF